MANASLFSFQEADTGGTLWIQTTWKALSNLDECGALMAFCLRGRVSQSLPLPPVVVETVVQDKQYKCGGFSLTQPFGFWEPILWIRRIWTSLSLQRCFLEWKLETMQTSRDREIRYGPFIQWWLCSKRGEERESSLCADTGRSPGQTEANTQHVISHYIPFLPLSFLSSFIYSTKYKVWKCRRKADRSLKVWGQPGLCTKFQDSWKYTMKLFQKKNNI